MTNDKPVHMAGDLAPMLAPSKIVGIDIPTDSVRFPCYVSVKHNGHRATARNGKWIGRSGKVVRMCPAVANYMQPILDYATENCVVLDGEMNSSMKNTAGATTSILAGTVSMPDDFKFKCFYVIPNREWNVPSGVPVSDFFSTELSIESYQSVDQILYTDKEHFLSLVDGLRSRNLEGFMLTGEALTYKHGRVTEVDGGFLKFKYYSDPEDAEIIGLAPRKERCGGVDVQVSEFGYAKATHKQGDLQDTDIAGCMMVRLADDTILASPFPLGWDLEKRRQAYLRYGKGGPLDLKGRWVSFRRLSCESRDKPVAIKNVEIRDNK